MTSFEKRLAQWSAHEAEIRESYQRPPVERDTWSSPDANVNVIEQRVRAEAGDPPTPTREEQAEMEAARR